MTQTSSRTETEAPTVRLVSDLGPVQPLDALVAHLKDVSATLTCLQRFQRVFRDGDEASPTFSGVKHTGSRESPFYLLHSEREELKLTSEMLTRLGDLTSSALMSRVGRARGFGVLYMSYRNPLELWVALAAVAMSAKALPHFSDFVVSVSAHLRDWGSERRRGIAEATQAEEQAKQAALTTRDLHAVVELRAGITQALTRSAPWLQNHEAHEATDAHVSLEDAAAMLRVGSTLLSVEDVTGQEPPSVS